MSVPLRMVLRCVDTGKRQRLKNRLASASSASSASSAVEESWPVTRKDNALRRHYERVRRDGGWERESVLTTETQSTLRM